MRALLVVICLSGLALAAPKYTHTPSTSTDPAVVAAERKWTIAAASRGPAQSDLWEDAASAFIAIAEAGKLPETELVLAARAGFAALKNAIAVDPRGRERPPAKFDSDVSRIPVPQELTPRDMRMIRVLDVVGRFETNVDERASLAFLRANIWRRYDQHDKAIPIYLDLIANHAAHEVAEYSANLLLDTYNRMQRYDELLAFAAKLHADRKFLANRPQLEATVARLHTQGQTLVAKQMAERARETGDRRYFEKCADAYIAIVDQSPRRSEDDVILYSALTCYEQAGALDRARDTLRRMITDFPSSQLTKRADVRVIYLLSLVGRFEEAATEGERWIRDNLLEREAPDLLEETIHWRAASSGLDAALRTFDAHVGRSKRPANDRIPFVAQFLAERFLDEARTQPPAEAARSRAVAARLMSRPPPFSRTVRADADSRIELARVIAAAACPIPLVDGLCLRPRDQALLASARRELSRVQHPNDSATLFLADLAFEAILAKRAPTANLDADYRHLATSADADVRVAALARLAAFAKHTGDKVAQTKHLEACLAESFASRAGDSWLAICERELSLSRPMVPPASAPVPIVLEAPPRPITTSLRPDVPVRSGAAEFESGFESGFELDFD